MLLNSLKLILQDFFEPSARVEPIYFRLNRHGFNRVSISRNLAGKLD